ncbi:NF-kappa-B essential modulator [Magallana gigas]|uniref:NF-kappa-B essential modulator n=1 Tax=Magallana gigas TaxID=29159 RepID=UPI003341CE16
MDHRRNNAQDVLRCHLCETPAPPMYCDICNLNLCKPCVGEHLSDESTEHKVVPFRKRGSTLYCSKHSTKLCHLHCEQCDIPICVQCVSSGEHIGHKQNDILKFLENKNEALLKNLKELENLIYPKYQEIASYISVQKSDLRKNSKKLKTALDKQGETLHREIDNAIKKLKNDVDELESKDLVVLDKQDFEIKRNISEITRIIADVKKLLDSNGASRISSYKFSISKYRRIPPKVTVSLTSLSSQKINKKQIYQLFGSLSAVNESQENYTSSFGSPPSASSVSSNIESGCTETEKQKLLDQIGRLTAQVYAGQEAINYREEKLKKVEEENKKIKKELNNVIPVLRAQAEVWKSDFDAERDLRERLCAEKCQIENMLKKLQLRNQQLLDEMKNDGSPYQPPAYPTQSYSDQPCLNPLCCGSTNMTTGKFKIGSKENGLPQYMCPVCLQTFPDIKLLRIHSQICGPEHV